MDISDDVLAKLIEDSGATREAVGTIKEDIVSIKVKLEEKADGALGERVKSLEDDLKPFRPVGKFMQNNTGFVLICFMVVICLGILEFTNLI